MTRHEAPGASFGARLALIVGVGLVGAGAYVGLVENSPAGAVILVLIGASALSGWVKARRPQSR
jgi:hypothetical protein